MAKQAEIFGLQRLACLEEIDDGGDAKRFVLCAVAMGDKSLGRREILEVHSQSVADDVHSDGTENNFSRHGRFDENNVNRGGEGSSVLCVA